MCLLSLCHGGLSHAAGQQGRLFPDSIEPVVRYIGLQLVIVLPGPLLVLEKPELELLEVKLKISVAFML